jgi:hypothetical protein
MCATRTDPDDFNRFCALIRAMDAAYLAYFKDKPPDAQPWHHRPRHGVDAALRPVRQSDHMRVDIHDGTRSKQGSDTLMQDCIGSTKTSCNAYIGSCVDDARIARRI